MTLAIMVLTIAVVFLILISVVCRVLGKKHPDYEFKTKKHRRG